MSKLLRRPMFRKGGQVMDGVMSLAEPRQKYQEAGPVKTLDEMIKDDPYLQKVYGLAKAGYGRDIQQEKSDVLANLLIRGGLAAVSGKGATGSTLRDLASAFQAPTDVALKEMAALKQDPAKMLVAKAAIEQKGAERLKLLDLQNKKLDAEKKASILLGANATPEQIQKKAAEILNEQIFGVSKRQQENIKNREIENIQSIDKIQSKQAAEMVYEFRKNAETIKQKTGQEIGQDGGLLFGVPRKGKVDYSAAARNVRDGIYYDPTQNIFIKVQNNIPEIISNPLKEKINVSGLPGPKKEDIVTKQQKPTVLEQQKKNPFLYMG